MSKKKLTVLSSLAALLLIGFTVYKINEEKPKISQAYFTELTEELRAKGVNVGSISYLPENNEISVQIAEDDESIMKDTKQYVEAELEKKELDEVLVSVDNFDFEKSYHQSKWLSASSEIDEQLKKESDEYTGVAVDFHPNPIKYILKSSFTKSNYDGAELERWIRLTNDIIESNDLPNLLKEGESYKIRIRGKDKKILLSNSFEMKPWVKDITIRFWNQAEDEHIEDREAINSFVSASHTVEKLDKVIKTEPLLRYEYTNEDRKMKSYHLWLSKDNKGYIQSLLPGEDTDTYKLSGPSSAVLKSVLHGINEKLELPVKIEFE
ncbi:hypothetical protein AAEO50_06455 [Rossellomorea oryzaecorticis]|uniref:YhfM-like domain-containing protein n=1 Tax=Rossellomorea oryzaecorticis TaxID=1396505 RepID=A0ABU9K7D9_9BACI